MVPETDCRTLSDKKIEIPLKNAIRALRVAFFVVYFIGQNHHGDIAFLHSMLLSCLYLYIINGGLRA